MTRGVGTQGVQDLGWPSSVSWSLERAVPSRSLQGGSVAYACGVATPVGSDHDDHEVIPIGTPMLASAVLALLPPCLLTAA